MSYLEAIIFGIVQGITEFLPISSTAHIVITELLLGYHFPGLAFEILLHIASVFAVIFYFRKDIALVIKGFFSYFSKKTEQNRIHFWYGIYIIIATFITGFLGILLKDLIQNTMKTPTFIAGALTVTAVFLILIERVHQYGSRTEKEMKITDAIFVGLGQALAILPGISRSGATLILSLWVGLSRDTAVKFSFILAIPVILGSSVLAVGEIHNDLWQKIGTGPLIISFIATFLFSLVGIMWLINFLNRGKLLYFAIYLFVVAALVYFFIEPTYVIDI